MVCFSFFEWQWNLSRYVLASLMTKSGIIKDERDTPHRRVRHWVDDGVGVIGGLYLYTNDADSYYLIARTRTLHPHLRAAYQPSTYPAAPPHPHHVRLCPRFRRSAPRLHPLARSYSHGTVLESEFEHDFDPGRDYDDLNDGEEDHTISKSGEWRRSTGSTLGATGRL